MSHVMNLTIEQRYSWGVRGTWVFLCILYGAVVFLIPTGPGESSHNTLFLSGIFTITAFLGAIAHLALFAQTHPPAAIKKVALKLSLWKLGFGFLWISTIVAATYWAIQFVFAVWAAV